MFDPANFSINREWRTRWVRIIGWVLVATTLTLAIGVPWPSSEHRKEAELYPCMNCPCGCSSAQACWDNCCCYTDAEKIAWAEQNGVTPPDFLVARAAASSRPACAHCCERPQKQAAQEPQESLVPSEARVTLFFAHAKCKGISYALELLSHGVLSKPQGTLPSISPLIAWIPWPVDTSLESRHPSPDPPIP